MSLNSHLIFGSPPTALPLPWVSISPTIRTPNLKELKLANFFCQMLFAVCPICAPKKAFHPVCKKKLALMFMKLTPGVSPYFFRKLCCDFQQLATLQSSLILKVQQEVLSSDILMEANVQLHSIQI
jgi:hypothetical protein